MEDYCIYFCTSYLAFDIVTRNIRVPGVQFDVQVDIGRNEFAIDLWIWQYILYRKNNGESHIIHDKCLKFGLFYELSLQRFNLKSGSHEWFYCTKCREVKASIQPSLPTPKSSSVFLMVLTLIYGILLLIHFLKSSTVQMIFKGKQRIRKPWERI